MKISRCQLDELIRLITKSVLKEYSSMSNNDPSDDSADTGTADDGVKPADARTAVEKNKAERAARKAKQDKIRTADLDLKGVKSQQNYFMQQAKKNKLDITAKEKQLQQMKGAPISTVPAGGTVAENIRKLRA